MNFQELIIASGYIGITLIIFAESGLLIGVFFPGDSLLFTAGFLASQGIFNIAALVFLCFMAAVVGDSVGYTFGRRVGRRFFSKPESLIFNPENIERARLFYEKHGGKAIILARFIPGIRTLAPILAGIGEMHYQTFLLFNLTGGLLWAVGLTLLGYFLGSVIPNADKYLIPIVGAIILISVAPSAIQILGSAKKRQQLWQWLKKFFVR